MSTAISGRMSKEIQEEVSRLLGRGRTTFECPLNEEERQTLWHGMLNSELVKSFEVLEKYGHNIEPHRTYDLAFSTQLEGWTYSIRFWNAGPYRLIREHQDHYRTAGQIILAFPRPDDWLDFVQWVQNTGRIERDFTDAQKTLENLLGFCSTIGQLTRAVPELAQYLSREKRELLSEQKRASNMPYEWATFDRRTIDNLQHSLAKAHLMPMKNGVLWDDIKNSRATLLGETE